MAVVVAAEIGKGEFVFAAAFPKKIDIERLRFIARGRDLGFLLTRLTRRT